MHATLSFRFWTTVIIGFVAGLQTNRAVLGEKCPNLDLLDFLQKDNICDKSLKLQISFGPCGVSMVFPNKAANMPIINFADAKNDKKYILFMVDPDAPTAKEPVMRYWVHWVLADVLGPAMKSGQSLKGSGTVMMEYNGPTPPPGSGPHRYQIFIFEQPPTFNSISGSRDGWNRGGWNPNKFVAVNQLCNKLVASYQFKTEYPNLKLKT